MPVKPSDFFIGLVDFVAIILPGAILAYLALLVPWWPDSLQERVNKPLAEPGAPWVAFGVVSFALGHVLHHFGGLLDRRLYDRRYRWWRERAFDSDHDKYWVAPQYLLWKMSAEEEPIRKQLKAVEAEIARARKPSSPLTDRWEEVRALYDQLGDLRRQLRDLGPGRPVDNLMRVRAWALMEVVLSKQGMILDPDWDNVFAWADVFVRARNPAAAAELDRAGVDSKFFRSMALVAIVATPLIPILIVTHPAFLTTWWLLDLLAAPAAGIVAAAVAVFSLWRYCERRWKAAEQTYRFFVILNLPDAKPPSPPAPGG